MKLSKAIQLQINQLELNKHCLLQAWRSRSYHQKCVAGFLSVVAAGAVIFLVNRFSASNAPGFHRLLSLVLVAARAKRFNDKLQKQQMPQISRNL